MIDDTVTKAEEGEKLKRLGISSLSHTFEEFEQNKANKQAWEGMRAVGIGESGHKFVLLYGVTGTGKTHLIEAMLIEMDKRNVHCYYRTFSDIARSLKSSFSTPGQYERRFKGLCNTKVLIIDDYGMGTTESRFEVSDLEDIIDLRYRRRYYHEKDVVTVLATNKSVGELPERVVSRFLDREFGIALKLGGNDYRSTKR